MQALHEDKAMLQKSEEVRKVRTELEAKWKEVEKLRGTSLHGTLEMTKSISKSKAQAAETNSDEININALRQDEDLRKIQLEVFNLSSNQGSINRSNTQSFSSSSSPSL